MSKLRSILHFFDRLEDKIRARLSRYPILYGLVGGIGIVLFWRGVWHSADAISAAFLFDGGGLTTINLPSLADGLISLAVGTLLLLSTGLFVLSFIGNEVIISGIKGDKRLAEKTEEEVKTEKSKIEQLKEEVEEISEKLDELKK